ncbi:hypothetical protein Slin15195_G097530 [Septoria linicola]|uniref:Uncharacterized protein n=1 Tax=Septoria linicola TaxID=215465 RepID=A0A9Q9AVX7_9PEZI|nr:hypothetical protein Slin15195_G097530 [Septoria linicola]
MAKSEGRWSQLLSFRQSQQDIEPHFVYPGDLAADNPRFQTRRDIEPTCEVYHDSREAVFVEEARLTNIGFEQRWRAHLKWPQENLRGASQQQRHLRRVTSLLKESIARQTQAAWVSSECGPLECEAERHLAVLRRIQIEALDLLARIGRLS